jgi:hypothetical protein
MGAHSGAEEKNAVTSSLYLSAMQKITASSSLVAPMGTGSSVAYFHDPQIQDPGLASWSAAQKALATWPPPYTGGTKQGVWVEQGVLWLMPDGLPFGFTDLPSMQAFYGNLTVSFTGPNPVSYPADTPFPITVMPAVTVEFNYSSPNGTLASSALVVWPLVTSMSFANAFLNYSGAPTIPRSSGPFVAPQVQSFPAATPQGVQNFSATFLLYSSAGRFVPGTSYGLNGVGFNNPNWGPP